MYVKAILLLVAIVAILFGYNMYKNNVQFEKWYAQVSKMSPYYGFTQQDIDEFERGVWWVYYSEGLSAEDAIKQYLKDT